MPLGTSQVVCSPISLTCRSSRSIGQLCWKMQFGLGLALLGCVSVQGQFGSKSLSVGDTIQPGKITLDYGFPPSKVRSGRLGPN
jgi:hypothetical protein